MSNNRNDLSISEAGQKRRRPPAKTSEARENQMIALAMDLAEKQIIKGTATSQIIAHFLKLGSIKEKRELALLEEEIALKRAKTKAIEDAKDIKELYAQALLAMSRYAGNRSNEDECLFEYD